MKKYWIYFKADLQRMFEYRVDNIIYAVSNITTPLISLGLWMAVASNGSALAYSKLEIILYFLTGIAVRSVTQSWADYYLEEEILTGKYSSSLIRPFSAVEQFAVHHLSEKLFRAGFVVIVVLILGYFLQKELNLNLNFTPFTLVFFIFSLFVASIMNLLLDVIIGLSTFWFHEVEFVRSISSLVNELFSGKIIPLAFLPGAFFSVALFLPFRYTYSLPIEILLNRVNGTGLAQSLMIQLVWLIICFAVYKMLIARGNKLYQGYGA